jgi:AAHS family 4-hydroxybenzoate transporter-like MFS transporter
MTEPRGQVAGGASVRQNINDFIDQRPVGRFQLRTIGLCGLVLLLDGFDTQSMGFLVPPIAEELGIPLSAFGPVLAAGLVGLMLGTMTAGPIADRWGRRWAIILSTFVFGAFSLATAQAGSLGSLVTLRFLTGLGLGGAMPNVVALSSEYAPKRLQPILVTAIFVGMGAGAVVASLLSSVLIPAFGWRSVFYVGGVAPIGLGLVLLAALPESVRFLSVRGGADDQARRILARLAPDVDAASIDLSTPAGGRLAGAPVKHLFTEGRAAGTVLLWVPFFMNLLILYFVLSWLPALLRQAGMPVAAGITAVFLFSLGGIIGTLAQGPLMKAIGTHRVIVVEFVASVALVALAAAVFESYALMMTVTFVLGVCVQGAQAGLNALSAMYYPTVIRSTGVGWALGVGRVGSIVGPVIGGWMLGLQWTPQQIFTAGAVPAACAGIAVLVSLGLQRAASPYRTTEAPLATTGH